MQLKKKLGKRIRDLRRKSGYTQAKLAELAGIAAKTQSCIETGRNFPSADLIERYAQIFGVDEDDIFTFDNQKSIEDLKQQIAVMINNADSKDLAVLHKIIKGYLF